MKYLFALVASFTVGLSYAQMTTITGSDGRGGTAICNVYCDPDGRNCRVVCL